VATGPLASDGYRALDKDRYARVGIAVSAGFGVSISSATDRHIGDDDAATAAPTRSGARILGRDALDQRVPYLMS
jgi:hypothetical protein